MHIDNWLFILLVAIAMLFRWLASAASKANKASKNSDDDENEGSIRQRTDSPWRTSTPPPTASPARTAPVESDQERIRKFLEALGQAPGSPPPPPVTQRPSYQKPIILPHVPPPLRSPLPPLTTRPSDVPNEPSPFAPITQTPQRKKTFKPSVSETTFEVRERTTPSEPAPAIKSPAEAYAIATEAKPDAARSETNITALLRSPSGLRNAIILREVFGPPRSLQPLELV
jgi:hypothetical protein